MELLEPLAEPAGAHLDSWAAILIGLTLLFALAGVLLRNTVREHWAHHPFRVTIEGHLANALLASAGGLALIALSHAVGWPIYGLPVVGLTMVVLALAVGITGGSAWWLHFRKELARYDVRHPHVAQPDADELPQAKSPRTSAPMLWAFGAGITAYAVFVWHPWPHLFHEGNIIYGAPAGYAIGSLVAMYTAGIMAPALPRQRAGRGKRSKRR